MFYCFIVRVQFIVFLINWYGVGGEKLVPKWNVIATSDFVDSNQFSRNMNRWLLPIG